MNIHSTGLKRRMWVQWNSCCATACTGVGDHPEVCRAAIWRMNGVVHLDAFKGAHIAGRTEDQRCDYPADLDKDIVCAAMTK